MAEIQNFLLFLTLTWILIITPGPDLIYVLTKGMSIGKKAGFYSAMGVTLGILVHTIFAALGLSLILKSSATAFFIIKMTGAGYLIYLGIKSIASKSDFELMVSKKASLKKVFLNGFITNTLNPKVALFFLAFLPQFIKTSATNDVSTVPFLILGSIFACCTMAFLCTVGYYSGIISQYFNTKDAFSKKIKNVSGTVMILLGLRLAFMNQD